MLLEYLVNDGEHTHLTTCETAVENTAKTGEVF